MSFADHSEVELERLEAERTAERKAAVRSGSLLYPREFAEGLPPGRSWDQRPLVNLLRGHHSDADAEIERIERWFRELKAPEERKRPLYGNLREVAPRNFWSGLYELMTDRIFREQGWISNYEPDIEGRTPDFLVECPEIDNYRFVAEVMTASQGSEADEQERMLYAVASELDKLEHRIGELQPRRRQQHERSSEYRKCGAQSGRRSGVPRHDEQLSGRRGPLRRRHGHDDHEVRHK